MLNESQIRCLAMHHKLAVHKRVTTGTDAGGFATFELTGPAVNVGECWQDMRPHFDGAAIRGGFAYMRSSDADGRPYIGLESVYFAGSPAQV